MTLERNPVIDALSWVEEAVLNDLNRIEDPMLADAWADPELARA